MDEDWSYDSRSHPALERAELEERNPDLLAQLDEWGLGPGSCDWGGCNGEQIGWARSAPDEEFLPICQRCLDHGGSRNGESLRVSKFVPLPTRSGGC